jgi:hypothetical protein
MWYNFIYSVWFWVILTAVTFFSYSTIKSTPLKRLPIFNNRKMLLIAGIVGIVLTSGVFTGLGVLGTGSLLGASGIVISDIQVTTAHGNNTASVLSESSNFDDLLDIRLTDAQVAETASFLEINGTGVLTVTRTGDLKASSCQVRALLPADFEDESAPTGTKYNIVEKTALGEYEVYIETASTSTSASTSSPKETTTLAFAEGVAKGFVSVVIEIDEEGHDALNQYNSKDIMLDICGKPYIYRVHRMD